MIRTQPPMSSLQAATRSFRSATLVLLDITKVYVLYCGERNWDSPEAQWSQENSNETHQETSNSRPRLHLPKEVCAVWNHLLFMYARSRGITCSVHLPSLQTHHKLARVSGPSPASLLQHRFQHQARLSRGYPRKRRL